MNISATMPSTSARRPNFIGETTLLSLALAATLHRDQLARQPLVDPTAVAVRLLHSLHGQSIHDQTLGRWLFATPAQFPEYAEISILDRLSSAAASVGLGRRKSPGIRSKRWGIYIHIYT